MRGREQQLNKGNSCFAHNHRRGLDTVILLIGKMIGQALHHRFRIVKERLVCQNYVQIARPRQIHAVRERPKWDSDLRGMQTRRLTQEN
jgi:hypothetical protein